ncbi:MAG: hypothetical protein U9N02_08550 [Campylobacterota bacterium]|nr:hypothetical protein [Campylobacterota bacterium]
MSKKNITLVDIYNSEDATYRNNPNISLNAQRSKQEVSLDKDAFIKAINKYSDLLKDLSLV